MPVVLVPRARLTRWVENFEARHGSAVLGVVDGRLEGRGEDGSVFVAEAPFGSEVDEPSVAGLSRACEPPADWGVLLVRKGGFAVARLAGERLVESKVGQRHVQGRTKAGGQSQQRFARRRANQARAAYDAAADHAARILAATPVLVTGGDHGAVSLVLEDPRLRTPAAGVTGSLLDVGDPRRGVLERAIADACSVRIDVDNA